MAIVFLTTFICHCGSTQTLQFVRQVPVVLDDPNSLVKDFVISRDGNDLYYTQYNGTSTHEIVKVTDLWGSATARNFTDGAQMSNNSANCLCRDGSERLFLTDAKTKKLTCYLSSGIADESFGTNGSVTLDFVPSEVSISADDARLYVSGLQGTQSRPYLYLIDARSGSILDQIASFGDPDDTGTTAGLKTQACGSMYPVASRHSLLANVGGDLAEFALTMTGTFVSAKPSVLRYHASYNQPVNGMDYNPDLQLVAYTGGHWGQKASRNSMMVWLYDMNADIGVPVYMPLDKTAPDHLGETFSAIRWFKHNGTHYLCLANQYTRCLNLYRYFPAQATSRVWRHTRTIDLNAYIPLDGHLKSVTTLPNNDLVFSCYLQNKQQAPYYLHRIASPATTGDVSIWSEDTHPQQYANSLTTGGDGYVYFCCAAAQSCFIKKYNADGKLVKSFGLDGVAQPVSGGIQVCPQSLCADDDVLLVAHKSYDTVLPNALTLVDPETGASTGSLIPSVSDTNEDGQLEDGGVVWTGLFYDAVGKAIYGNAQGNLIKMGGIASLSSFDSSVVDGAQLVNSQYTMSFPGHALAGYAKERLVAYTVTCDVTGASSPNKSNPVHVGIYNCVTGGFEYLCENPSTDGMLDWGGAMTFFEDNGVLYLAAISHYDNTIKIFARASRPSQIADWSRF